MVPFLGDAVFDWLFEGHLSVYILLAVAAAVCVLVWRRTRKRRWLAAAGVCVALAGLYFLLDYAVETDREQIRRKVNAMAADLKEPARLDAAFENVSDRFRCPFAQNKAELRDKARQQIQTWRITDIRISDLKVGEISGAGAVADFRAKIVGSFGQMEAVTVHCTATFDHDATHGWRMSGLDVKGEPPLPADLPL